MLRFSTTLILALISALCFCQSNISTDKAAADSFISKHFSLESLNRLRCISAQGIVNDTFEISFPDCESIESAEEQFQQTEFGYSLFSESINHYLNFYIIVRNQKIQNERSAFLDIPICFFETASCKFVDKEHAIQAAISDSIEQSDSFHLEFFRNEQDDTYYWEVTGYKHDPTRKSRTARKLFANQRRYINATTGISLRTLPN